MNYKLINLCKRKNELWKTVLLGSYIRPAPYFDVKHCHLNAISHLRLAEYAKTYLIFDCKTHSCTKMLQNINSCKKFLTSNLKVTMLSDCNHGHLIGLVLNIAGLCPKGAPNVNFVHLH